MQITLSPSRDVKRNQEIMVIGKIEEYLTAIGMKALNMDKNFMSGTEIYTNLLVPPRSGIRINPKDISGTVEKKNGKLEELYRKKYGCFVQAPECQRISTTTAVLISRFLCGEIHENTFLSMPVWRGKNCFFETEIILPDSSLPEGEKILTKIFELFLPEDTAFSVNPTWFSWASQAENFRIENQEEKWGAIGVLRSELAELKEENFSKKKVVIIGLPVKTLSKYYFES